MNARREQRFSRFANVYSKRIRIAAGLAPQRLADFRATIEGRRQCPKCWIYDGREAAMNQVASEMQGHETFQCETCEQFISFAMPSEAPRGHGEGGDGAPVSDEG